MARGGSTISARFSVESSLGRLLPLVALVASSLGAAVAGAETVSSGHVAVEARAFEPDKHDSTEDYGVALAPHLELKSKRGPWQLALRGFARLDAFDETRKIMVLEEAYGSYSKGRLSVSLGSQILNWTATEAFHPADIINSRNFDSDVEDFEKFGEPMAVVRLRMLGGYWSAHYMPVRVSPHLPPDSSRLSLLPVTVELGDPLWLDRDGRPSDSRFEHQGALQWSQTFGRADVTLHLVQYNDRQLPTTTVDPQSGALRPTYHMVTQAGLTYVHVFGGLIVKFESAYRSFVSPDTTIEAEIDPQADYVQSAAGLDYGWTTSAGHDATVIFEGQSTVRTGGGEMNPFVLYRHGVLFGYRHAFNDVKGRQLQASFIVDADTPYEYVASASYQQRLTDLWTIEGAARSIRLTDFSSDQAADQVHLVANQLQLNLARHF